MSDLFSSMGSEWNLIYAILSHLRKRFFTLRQFSPLCILFIQPVMYHLLCHLHLKCKLLSCFVP